MSSQDDFRLLKRPLEEIVQATNNFADKNLIGQGGFGRVYKGNLLVSGKATNIAVRRLHYDYGQGDLEFWNEISMLASLKHENLVSFIGFCDERGEKIIINEHEVNGSLDQYINIPTLTWMQRLEICVGVAHALVYIHCGDGHKSSVIHGNVKSSKILLDEKWKPKLSGFEHSKTNSKARRHRLVLADVTGTIGYVDPTYEKTGFVSHKSDVYSLGVVLFEVLCGRRAFVPDQREHHSPQFTKQEHEDGELDVTGKLDENVEPHVHTKGKLKESLKSIRRKIDSQPQSFAAMRASFYGKPSFDLDGPSSSVNGAQNPSLFDDRKLLEVKSSDENPSSSDDGNPSSSDDGNPSSFVNRNPSSFGEGGTSSFSKIVPSQGPIDVKTPPWFLVGRPSLFTFGQSSSSTDELTMKSLEPSHTQLEKFHYDEGNWDVDNIIDLQTDGKLKEALPSIRRKLNSQPPSCGAMRASSDGPSSFMNVKSSSVTTKQPSSPSSSHGEQVSTTIVRPLMDVKQTKERWFRLQPLFTMKRLDQYLHTPNENLLAKLAKSHYEEENLDDIIDPALREQMDPQSFKIFSDTAYNCLKEKRAQRPNIDQILRNLEKALKCQRRRENPLILQEDSIVAGEVKENRWDGRQLELLKIPLIDIEVATKNFTERYLGSGAYGDVYKAELELPIEDKSNGEIIRKWRTVAIKCIKDVKHGKDGFDAEIKLLTSCKHTNIVSLLGYCDEDPYMILVYEHASNRSLDDYLGSADSSTNLTWMQRIKIGIDIAHGLNYLHTRVEDEKRIIHRDIKSGNILLAKNWVAKIADFGLSRFHHASNQANALYTNTVAGTEEYVCPEYMNTGRLKRAIDIYSFGVVLFEILSGKLANHPIYVREDKYGIAPVARRHFKESRIHEMVDPKIMEEVDELTSTLHKGPNQDSLKTYTEIAYQCISVTQDDRPSAKDILEELEKALLSQENNKDNLQMSFEEIKLATQNFSRANIIGRGGFGKVFKGEVARGNETTTIVAKRLDRSKGQGEHHFLMELEILFEYKHENIIGLEGYCNENNEKIIVYEYASNRSLDRYLNDVSLTWIKRLKICIDIAGGLAFLHGGAPTKEMVIHRDIKSANILLTDDWKAKISDFGLSAITGINQEVISKLVGTNGYVEPLYEETGFFTEKSDIYSFGVLLFEILYGKLLVPNKKDYDLRRVNEILNHIHGDFGLIVFDDIKDQISPKSLFTFRMIVSQCLVDDRKKRPTAEEILQQLEKSLEFQEDYEIWGHKLPEDYEEILKLSKSSRTSYFTANKKDLYNLLSKGILLLYDKVWFSLGSNGERNEMISARKFSYRNRSPHKWSVVSESRFQKVAEMLDISNLMIKIKTRTKLLSPNTVYGVYLVFKFCDSKNVSSNPMYVNLKYRMGSKTLHAYIAKWRDDMWMMIQLYQFLNQKENAVFKFLLESLSPYYCRDDAIYVEGIEFRAIDNPEHDEAEKSKEIQQVVKANSIVDQELQLPTKSEEMFKRSKNNDHGEKLFTLAEVNGKKHLVLSAKAALYNFSDLKLFNPTSLPPESRFAF